MSAGTDRQADAALAARCLQGSQEAWHELFHRFHGPVITGLVKQLGPGRRHLDLAEEIGAVFWWALVADGGRRLRAFDPARGSLAAFLAAVARQVRRNYLRSQAPRLRRQRPLAADEPAAPGLADEPAAAWVEPFRATLPARQRAYFDTHLLGRSAGGPLPPLSPANLRQLRRRVLCRLLAFLAGEPAEE